jgi:hypothetical protein
LSLPLPDTEKTPDIDISIPTSSKDSAEYDMENHPKQMKYAVRRTTSIQSGRPDIANIITSLIQTADKSDRIAVAACGPDTLMAVTRRTVAGCIKPDGPSVELHCEQFGF